jgi:hypothetical protein
MVKNTGRMPGYLKAVIEASVRSCDPACGRGMLRELGYLPSMTECARFGRVSPIPRFWGRPGQPGVQPSTYRIARSSFEHENLNPSAGYREARRAAKSGDVLDEGRSLRSSRSTGKP